MKRLFIIIFIIIFTNIGILKGKVKFGPSYKEISVTPGEKKDGFIYFENTGNNKIALLCFVNNFKSSKENRRIDWKKWLKLEFNPTNIVIPPKSKKILKYKVIAPHNLKGEVSAKISFLKVMNKRGTGINTEMSVAVYLISRKNSYIGGEIRDFNVSYLSNNIFMVSFELKNKGNIHLRPSGKIFIYTDKKRKRLITGIKIPKSYPLFENKKVRYEKKFKLINKGKNRYIFEINLSLGYNNIYNIKKEYFVELNNNKILKIKKKNE